MTEEKDELQGDGPEIEVEVIPEPAEEKPRLKTGDTSGLDVRDDELASYGKDVQARIKKLRFAFHEERRLREQAQRDGATAQDMAQRLFRENGELKRSVQQGEAAVIHQAMVRVDAQIERARAQARAAQESGVAQDIVAASEALAKAVSEKERLALIHASQPAEEERQAPSPAAAAPPPPPQQDERTREWFSRNSWWEKPGEEERTAFAKGVHNKLLAQGITAFNNPDLYWRTIDERLAAVFPEKANGNGNGAGHSVEEDEDRQPKNSRPLAVAGGMRSTGSAQSATRTRVIRLSESQVRVARRLGITPEQYAQQLAIDEGAAANG